ncbi:hypothetical protein HRbin12_01241 [bacterium HR12]|nr:hypothetical protein HRbin12_01241 [bacterium HR12]
MRLPFVPSEVLAEALREDPERVGEAIARAALGAWEDPRAQQAAMGLLRAAASHEGAAAMLRQFVRASVIAPIAEAIGTPDAEVRAALVASQMVGVAMARYLVRIEPLASASVEDIVRAIAPTLQRYLTGAIRPPEPPRHRRRG